MKIEIPDSEVIKQTRIKAGFSQSQCAELVHVELRSWQRWEAGDRQINGAAWELFLIKIGKRKVHNANRKKV